MTARLLALTLALGTCDVPVSGSTPPPPSHPLAEDGHLQGVLPDGSISPEWGAGAFGAPPLPDTVAAARMTGPQWLAAVERAVAAGSADTLRANVWVRVAGFHLCAPCPADLHCEPCGPSAVVGVAESVAGRAWVRFEVPHEVSLDGFAVGRRGVVSLEAVVSGGYATVLARGFTDRARPGPRPPPGPTPPDPG